MAIEIRQTIVTATGDERVVQLHIADGSLEDESCGIVLRLSVPIPQIRDASLEKIERETLKAASQVLRDLLNLEKQS